MDINIKDTDYRVQLMYDEYKDIISRLKKGEFHAFGDTTGISDNRFIGMQHDNKIYLMHFFPQGDIYANPPCTNQEDTYYETADIPAELQVMPQPIIPIKLNSREQVQTFFTNLGRYQRGELKLDENQNS